MHHVRRRVAVGEDDRTRLKICTPFHLKRSVAVDGKEGGCSVGVDFGRTFAEIAAEVHAHERRRRRSVVRELDLPHAAAFGDEPFPEHLRLRRLARAVARLQDEEFSLCLQDSSLLHASAISALGQLLRSLHARHMEDELRALAEIALQLNADRVLLGDPACDR